MGVRFRAAIGVLMLAGVYVLALSIVAGAAYGIYALAVSDLAGVIAGLLMFALGGVALAVVRGLRQALAPAPVEPSGQLVTEDDAPELWAAVRALAAEVRTRAPDEIRLIPDVNAAVTENTRLLGLAAGHRTMYLGAPLMLALSVGQLRSVLAHELGHYSGSDTRLGTISYLGRGSLLHIGARLSRWNPASWLLLGYFFLFLLVTQAISRRQEFLADQFSVRVAGRDTAISALQEIPVAGAAYGAFLRSYLVLGLEQNMAPSSVMAGFREFLAARRGELASLRADPEPEERSRWDSHPPIAERVRALSALSALEAGQSTGDDRQSTVLLGETDRLLLGMEQQAFDFGDRQVLDWDELIPAAAAAGARKFTSMLYTGAARLAGSHPAHLGTVLDLLASGRAESLGTSVFAQGDELASLVGIAVETTVVASGAGRLRPSWAGPTELVALDGTRLDFAELVAKAVADRAAVADLRARLAELNVDVTAGK
ncbi:M48 family metallopeptidase [Longispora albida]|uniref:M48 family metallopeptidase n=1 Tax=Longispora albida TaxID=203523 RepID=UPI000374285C|nr:M48 family metallopeptidase [Longispora albida]